MPFAYCQFSPQLFLHALKFVSYDIPKKVIFLLLFFKNKLKPQNFLCLLSKGVQTQQLNQFAEAKMLYQVSFPQIGPIFQFVIKCDKS